MSVREVTTNLYAGPTVPGRFSRGYREIESTIVHPFYFDKELAAIVENLPDNSEFRVFDLGSGSGAFLEALKNPTQSPLLLETLKRKKISLKAMGLTDSPDPKLFNQPVPVISSDLPSHRDLELVHEVKNYFYTLTAHQTLEHFFEGKELQTFHFINASQFFLYPSASIFEKTLQTLIQHLEENGKVLIIGTGVSGGPLPAFETDIAKHFRSPGQSQNTQDLNLFKVDEPISHLEIPRLTLREDWEELKIRLSDLTAKLEKRGIIHTQQSGHNQALSFLLEMYKQAKKGRQRRADKSPTRPKNNIDPQNLLTVNDVQAQEALRFYELLNGAIKRMKKRQYYKQVGAKQASLKRLKERSDIYVQVLKTILNDRHDEIDSVLITKNPPQAEK